MFESCWPCLGSLVETSCKLAIVASLVITKQDILGKWLISLGPQQQQVLLAAVEDQIPCAESEAPRPVAERVRVLRDAAERVLVDLGSYERYCGVRCDQVEAWWIQSICS